MALESACKPQSGSAISHRSLRCKELRTWTVAKLTLVPQANSLDVERIRDPREISLTEQIWPLILRVRPVFAPFFGSSRNCVCWLPVLCLMRELLLARGEFGRTIWGRTMGRHITRSISSHAYGGHASGRRGLLSSNRSGAMAWVGRLSPRACPSPPAGSALSLSSHCSALNCSAKFPPLPALGGG